MVRQVADFETNIVSVERIKEYSEVIQEVRVYSYQNYQYHSNRTDLWTAFALRMWNKSLYIYTLKL